MEQVKITYKGHEIELNRTEDGKFIKPEWLKKYEGSKSGAQFKPAVEHIIIGMKRTNNKSYVDNILDYEFRLNKETETTPFLQFPKPAKKEKDFGLTMEAKEGRIGATYSANQDSSKMGGNPDKPTQPKKNNHPNNQTS